MAKLVRIVNTSQFSPAAPDPAGIGYNPDTNTLLIADSEVDEIKSLFQGKNLFETNLQGGLQKSFTTTAVPNVAKAFSFEPTGIAYAPNPKYPKDSSKHVLYISDDDRSRVYQVDPGGDGKYNTSDDVVTYFSTKVSYISKSDSEDVAYSTKTGHLWVMDGFNAEVFEYTTDGKVVNHFDTASIDTSTAPGIQGILDPEGITEDPLTGNLFLVGRPLIEAGKPVYYVFEITNTGKFVSKIDISAANPVKPAGITIAPSSNSTDPSQRSLYIVDRGLDNDDHPTENDGRMYEFSLDSKGGNPTPAGASAPLDNPPASGTPAPLDNPPPSGTPVPFDPKSTIFVDSTALKGSNTVGGVTFDRQDILAYNQSTDTWSKYFEGSVLGLDQNNYYLRDFHINDDGSILFALNNPAKLPGGLKVDDSDVVKFTPDSPNSIGENTSGKFELYFDGSDVGLDTNSEGLDGIAIAPDGGLVISTTGSFTVPGSKGDLTGTSHDLLLFTGSTGENTVGTFTMLFDGSAVGLKDSSENVDGFWLEYDKNQNTEIKGIYLTTVGDFSVPGVNNTLVTGKGGDILHFTPTSPISLGSDNPKTDGTFELLPWDKSSNGIAVAGLTIEGIAVNSGFHGF